MNADVIVIGGGLSGLNAARLIHRAGKKVLVLEARDRVGGRTLSKKFGNSVIDVGAQWVGPTQDRILRLAEEQGLRTFPQHTGGRQILALGDKISTYTGTIPSLPVHSLIELHLRITKIEKECRRVPLEAPWTFPDAEKWDAMTVESWKQNHVYTRGARASLDAAVHAIFACEPSEISFLYFMHYLHSGGGLMRLADVKNGAQQDRIFGGTQQISSRMAADLGRRVILSSPVLRVEQTSRGVTVYTRKAKYSARRIIIALSPTLCSKIAFSPALPVARDQLHHRMPMGSVIKAFALYDRPFWRERGYSGEVVSDGTCVRLAFDASIPGSMHGLLVGFISGENAREWSDRTPREREAAVVSDFVRFFGEEASDHRGYLEQNWIAEEFSRGCYAGLMPPSVMTSFGNALRDPCGLIHWAGTETARHWNGYMEGALEAGERAAAEVLEAR